MPYYHVYIEDNLGETEEMDFSREQLLKDIIEPYSQNRKFLCKGAIIEPDKVLAIKILETERPSAEVLKKIRAEVGTVADVFASDTELLEKAGKDVTREFLTVRTKKRRKRVSKRKARPTLSKNVFIVHGRDHKPIEELKAMLVEFGLSPIVLHEQPSASRTVVEKLEHYSGNIGFAFVLLTPDDALVPTVQSIQVDKKQGTMRPIYWYKSPPILRARQNVILEFGYFISKIGRENVCCLYKGNTELPYDMPSDMHGIVYISFKESVNEARDKIAKELKNAGYEIKL